jgi:predicted amidohydrolase
MKSTTLFFVGLLISAVGGTLAAARPVDRAAVPPREETIPVKHSRMRIAAVQARDRSVDWKTEDTGEVLRHVDQTLSALEQLIHKAGAEQCDAVAFPEDTLGLLKWEAAHPEKLKEVLPVAVARMRERLGRAAASHGMYLVVCNDTIEADGRTHNTAFLLGRDGRELGHYDKVNLPVTEQARTRGDGFPVFATPDLGGVGMLICYDMVFPETTRCLALGGAEVVFVPTMGGASYGEGDMDRAAFRTRAADNFLWLVVAKRGGGSMIISPRGKVVAEASGPDGLAIGDIEPFAGREAGDAFNSQQDMRSRLFRERVPAAYGILTAPHPPVLDKVPETIRPADAIRIFQGALTVGEARFGEADRLQRAGKSAEAVRIWEQLRAEYPHSWIDRAAGERLAQIRDKEK